MIVYIIGFLTKTPPTEIVLENPLKNLVFANTDTATGQIDKEAVIEQAVIEFNADYINYLLVALGVGNLHKSLLGYGNPIVEFKMDQDYWNSEVDSGALRTQQGQASDPDLRISMSKTEAVEALLSSDMEAFMKQSVTNGNTQIEMIAGKVELGSKGYLSMYKDITGEEPDIE